MNQALFSSSSAEWETPQELFDQLNAEFHFTLDPCSTDTNAKCEKHYTKEQDGLSKDWTGETVYCNPPYGRQAPAWVRKCYEHAATGGGEQPLCCFQPEPTLTYSMISFTEKLRSDSFEEDCISAIVKTELHSHQ